MENKTKILLGVLGGILILIIFLVFHFLSSGDSGIPLIQNSSGLDSRVTKLEQEVNTLINDINLISSPSAALNPTSLSSTTSVADQLSTLNGTVNELNTRVTRLEQGVGVSTPSSSLQTTSSKVPIYIPLGSTDPNNNESWQSIDSMAVTLNPSDYPGYTSMQLEVGLRLNAGTGIANARLINSTTQSVIAASTVSTSSTTFAILTSSGFTVSAGSNLYTIQLLSTLGDTLFIQNARLKINF